MNLDEKLDEIFTCDRLDHRYPLCSHARETIKQFIEVLTMQLQVEEFTKFYFEVKKDGDIDKYYDKRRIELANIYKGDK